MLQQSAARLVLFYYLLIDYYINWHNNARRIDAVFKKPIGPCGCVWIWFAYYINSDARRIQSGRGQGEWRGACVSDRPLHWTHARISSCSWPRIFFNKMYKKRCEERRNPSLGARRCEGTGRGESPDAKEETAGTPAEEKLSSQGWRRRSSAGGGGTSASAPRGVERETRPRGTAGRGDFSPMSVGRAWFHGDIGLTRAGNPNVAGFQSRMSGSTWKDSAWAAGPGKWRGSRPGNGLPN